MEEQNICKNCGTELIEKATKRTAEQLKKPYYYTAYYLCPRCHKLYHNEKFKVINGQTGFWTSQNDDIHKKASSIPASVGGEAYDAEIWTDGACVHNGTPRAKAAWAFVSNKTEHAGVITGTKQTNNVAEGTAILEAIKWAGERKFKKIKIYTDSQISLFNLQKMPNKVKENREIFQNIADAIAEHGLTVDFAKVLGHSGDVNNERADALANGLVSKR